MKKTLDFLAVTCAIGGSTLIASNIGMNVLGYLLFLVSSVASLLLLKESNASRSLIVINLWFAAMNVLGIVRY